jgi:hypothetical protein
MSYGQFAGELGRLTEGGRMAGTGEIGDPVTGVDGADVRGMLLAAGEVGRDLLSVDWSSTPLGPPSSWPQSLQTAVRILLSSRFAMWMAWGPELTFLCNDAYRRDTLGKKYPWALGRPAREVWAEIWPDIRRSIRATEVKRRGGPTRRATRQVDDVDPRSADSSTNTNELCKAQVRPVARVFGTPTGDLVAILGLGGLGHLGVQFAVKMGFRTAVIARGQGKGCAGVRARRAPLHRLHRHRRGRRAARYSADGRGGSARRRG